MTELTPASKEWSYVAFRLQLILCHPNIQPLKVTRNPAVFDSQFQPYLKTDAAVDITAASPERAEEIRYNLAKNLVVECGSIKQEVKLSRKDEHRYRVLLLKVGVNQLMPLPKGNSLKPEEWFTGNYDTVYLAEQEEELAVFSYQYAVKSNKQYLWQYEVEYIYADTTTLFRTWSPDRYSCEHCLIHPAKHYCRDDKQIYCNDCFMSTHRSQKKSMHRKESLNAFNCWEKCPKHNDKLEYFCFECKELKCRQCLIDAAHGYSLKDTNGIVGRNIIGDKQHEVIETTELGGWFKEKEMQLYTEGKAKIASKIKEVETKITLINNHYSLRLRDLQRSFADSTKRLQEETSLELNRAVGAHTELKRKYDQFIWVQQFVEHVVGISDAMTNINLREGLYSYIENTAAKDYFAKVDKKIQEINIFT